VSAAQDPEVQLTLGLDLDNDKQNRLDVEKERVLSGVASAKFDTVQERVAWILNNFPETRNSDIALQLKYWERFERDIYDGVSIEPQDLYVLTRLNSLQRARAKFRTPMGCFRQV